MRIRIKPIRLRPIKDFFQGAVLLMALVFTALVSAVLTMHFAIHGAEVKVPALKQMTVAEARSQTSGLGLDLEVDNRYYSADVPAGHILSQAPAPGSVVRREWRVRVAESLGPQKVDVPSVLGQQERIAGLNLRRVGLEAGTVAHIPWPAAPEGTVIAQDPPPHAQGIERPGINLLVAAPDDTTPDGYLLPDFTGQPVTAAQSALARVGIKTTTPKFQDAPIPSIPSIPPTSSTAAPIPPKPTTLPGTILTQQPPAGSRIDVGGTVTLTVAK